MKPTIFICLYKHRPQTKHTQKQQT